MCRFVAYLGDEILLEEVMVKPTNSIIKQSIHARESTTPTNGDGFGIGWYAPHLSPNPALFTSVLPAWSDRNLLHLTAKIESPCFFAHVRAASTGGVSQYNCHPFIHGKWMLMHNGWIDDFILVKRHLRHLLDDDIYSSILGETDSEHFFALFLQLAKGKDLSRLSVIADVFQNTIEQANLLVKTYGKQYNSYFNVCITDGQHLLATRYCSNLKKQPESLHYFAGNYFKPRIGLEFTPDYLQTHQSVVVTSEKLNDFKAEWHKVPRNHMLIVDKDLEITLRPLSV